MESNTSAFERGLHHIAVVTADAGDRQIDRAVRDVLQLAREHLRMDVAFVSKFERGQRVFRQVDPDDGQQVIAAGGADPLEMSFCQRVIDGRLPEMVTDVTKLPDFAELPATPFRIGAHLSTPICLADGSVYGTLCCFSFAPDDSLRERDLKRLRMAAELVARLIDSARSRNAGGNSPPH